MLTKPTALLALVFLCGVGRSGEPVAVGPPFIAHLPQGTVELVGVTNDYRPTKQSQWWRPDGSVAPIGPFRALQKYSYPKLRANEQVRTFLVRFEDLPADASKDPAGGINSSTAPRWPASARGTRNWVGGAGTSARNPARLFTGATSSDAGSHLWIATNSSYAERVATRHNARPSRPAAAAPADSYSDRPSQSTAADPPDTYYTGQHYHRMFAARLSRYVGTTDLRVGVSMGEWETVISWKPDSQGKSSFSREGREWTVAFGKARTVRDTTQVFLKSPWYTHGLWNKRLVAVADDGTEHATPIGRSSAGDRGTAVFRGLPRSSITEFRLQVRPYRWVEFDNIALQPRQKTRVTVVSWDDPVNNEK